MQKIVLYIKDGDDVYRRVDMFDDETITLTSKIQDVRDIGKVFTDFSETFTVPASRENNKIFQHWYKSEIDNGFDARTRKDAIMEMDFSPFKRGKISLENVKLRDNKPFSYTVVFYGNLINLKDLLGDDELGDLPELDDYTHDYSSSNVKTGLQSGLSSGKIVYPLISHTKRFYYDSAQSSPEYSGNLYYNTTANSIGLAFDDLKPAIKCLTIIEAIEDKYTVANGYPSNIVFTRDFFNNTEFSNLYLWLSRNKGPIGGDENQEEVLSRICGDWGYSSGDLGFAVSGDTWSVTVENSNASYQATLTVTTSGGNTSIPFKMKAIDYVSGTTLKESTMAAGSSRTLTFELVQSFNPVNYQIKWIIESNTAISFTPQIELTKFIITNGTISGQEDAIYNINGTGNSISTVSEIIITQNVPKLKVIDFLTGIFKMFNLTAYYVEDVGDADFDKIKVDTLDEFYADRVNNPSEGEWDITKFVDTSRLQVNRAFEYSEIDFSYQEPSTLLSINHQEQFNDIFGDEEVRPQGIDRGTVYEVEVPFEHMKFERLFDKNVTSSSPYDTADTAYLTDILWGYSAAGEFTSDTDVTPNTGNYEPVLTKPLIFYAVQETGLTAGSGIKWISDSPPTEITQYYRPSNTNEDGTSSTAPSFTINFDDEIDEWNLQNYGGTTNSLFKKFYATYINGIFNEKKRIYKLKAYLSTDVLANYRLNDELIIQNRAYRINSIRTNFNTEVSDLELLNKLSND
ncbi:hypothetical protein [uncultured Mediterranean phage uvDeep1-CGR2-KM23-C896]|nr:hypothetical protein [uncultured Mediterranean phage uvDeep1-CGR2-KM23-C896]